MSCVIACKFEDCIVMSCDSAGTDENNFQTCRSDKKIFIKENLQFDILFGIAGSFRMRDILMYDLKLPKYSSDMSIDEYVRTKLVEKIRNLFIEKGLCKIEDNEQSFNGDILIGIENKLYQIESDFQVGENSSIFNCIGDGQELATGAMSMYLCTHPEFSMKKSIDLYDILEILNKALEITSDFKSTVKAPFYFEFLRHKHVLNSV